MAAADDDSDDGVVSVDDNDNDADDGIRRCGKYGYMDVIDDSTSDSVDNDDEIDSMLMNRHPMADEDKAGVKVFMRRVRGVTIDSFEFDTEQVEWCM